MDRSHTHTHTEFRNHTGEEQITHRYGILDVQEGIPHTHTLETYPSQLLDQLVLG